MIEVSPPNDIQVPDYGPPMSHETKQWWRTQPDLLVALLSNNEASSHLGLERLHVMLERDPSLIKTPPQARLALVGLLMAHGQPCSSALGLAPEKIIEAAPQELHDLAMLLLPLAVECSDADLPDALPADLVSASLIANEPQVLAAALPGTNDQTRTISQLSWVHHAAYTGKHRCLGVLLAHGCNPHELDAQGNTALHNASTPRVVKMLMDAGVDATLANNAGETPADAWARRTQDRARREGMLSVLFSSPASTPDPVESFFALAQSNNMGRLKSFARKLGVDFSIRHEGQGLVFNAALRLVREGLTVSNHSTVPQDARVASNWLAFLVQDKKALAAATNLERSSAAALVGALASSVRPGGSLSDGAPVPPGHLRHAVLGLIASMPKQERYPRGPSTQVSHDMQKLLMDAVEQCLDANDDRSASDASNIALFAFTKAASPKYMHQRMATILETRLKMPPMQCDALMLAACKSLREATRHSPSSAIQDFPILARMMTAMDGPLDETGQYLEAWSGPQQPDKITKAIEPLMAIFRARQMNTSTPQPAPPPAAPRRPCARF